MGNTAFELREEYAGTIEVEVGEDDAKVTEERDVFQGAVVALPPDGESFHVKDQLAKGGGLIVVDETNYALVDTLENLPCLKRAAAPDGAEGISVYGSLSGPRLKEIADARGVKPDGRKKDDYIAALEAADAALAAGETPDSADETTSTGDAGEGS
jgi:hypothetical protein